MEKKLSWDPSDTFIPEYDLENIITEAFLPAQIDIPSGIVEQTVIIPGQMLIIKDVARKIDHRKNSGEDQELLINRRKLYLSEIAECKYQEKYGYREKTAGRKVIGNDFLIIE